MELTIEQAVAVVARSCAWALQWMDTIALELRCVREALEAQTAVMRDRG